jgi:hypothetical protein
MSIKVVVRESGKGLDALRKATAAIRKAGSYVRVGVLAEGQGLNTHAVGKHGPVKQSGEPLTIAEIAAVHEFGSRDGKIPERSFMRSTFDEKRGEYVELMRKLLVQLVEQKIDVEKLLKIVGMRVSMDMRRKIQSGEIKPPNAFSTIMRKSRPILARRKIKADARDRVRRFRDRKGRFVAIKAKPLIDTGQLMRAITYAVVIVEAENVFASKAETTGYVNDYGQPRRHG